MSPRSIRLLTNCCVPDPAVAAANQAVTTAQGLRDAANLVAVADQATFDTATTAAQDASKQVFLPSTCNNLPSTRNKLSRLGCAVPVQRQ
jgi:hypothetical protein